MDKEDSEIASEPFNNGDFMFSDKTIRMGFIRKVYGILLCQLTVTMSFIALFTFEHNTKSFVLANWPILYGVTAVFAFIFLLVLVCTNLRRKYPANIILLSVFTLLESVVLGSVASLYEAQEVIMAVGVTAVVTLALTIFAFQTKWDFTAFSGILFVGVIVLLCFGLLVCIIPNRVLALVYASLGALIFSAYIVVDTQMMIGGRYKYSLSPEEYIYAALNLYLDVINLFLHILSIIGLSRN
jgi:FtsH-binding integral membrane protein